MSKKILLIGICLLLLTGCGKKNNQNKQEHIIYEGRTLIVFFSVTNNTMDIASRIGQITRADVVQLVPEVKYTEDDLNYDDPTSRAVIEQNNEHARPAIANRLSVEQYDNVFIGYPIWLGTNPKIILTLLDTYDFHGKKIVLFCTSGSTDITKSISDIKTYDNKLKIIGGRRFDKKVSNEDLYDWLDNLNIKKKTN